MVWSFWRKRNAGVFEAVSRFPSKEKETAKYDYLHAIMIFLS